MKKIILLIIPLLLTALLLNQCATTSNKAKSFKPNYDKEKEILYKRVTDYWNAIMKKDTKKIYEFFAPEDRKEFEAISFEKFSSSTFNTIDYHIDAIEISEDGKSAIVIVTNSFLAPPIPYAKTIPGQITRWKKVGDQWYIDIKSAKSHRIMMSGMPMKKRKR